MADYPPDALRDPPNRAQRALEQLERTATSQSGRGPLLVGLIALALVGLAVGGLVIVLNVSNNTDRVVRTAKRSMVTAKRSMVNRQAVRETKQEVEKTARRVVQNTRVNRAQDRVLIRSGIAKRGSDGKLGAAGERGAMGARGAAGRAAEPVSDQRLRALIDPVVASSIAALCAGNCKGADGLNGRDGVDGKDGATGPPPSQDQVTAGLLSLCTSGQVVCVVPGPQGPQGEKGEQGDPAPAVAMTTSLSCVPDPDPMAPSGAMVCTPR